MDLDHENTDYQGRLGDAGSFLSNRQMAKVLSEIYNDAGKTLENPIMCGIVDRPDGTSSLWRCEAVVRFPQGTPRLFSAKARSCFRRYRSSCTSPFLHVLRFRVRRAPSSGATEAHALSC